MKFLVSLIPLRRVLVLACGLALGFVLGACSTSTATTSSAEVVAVQTLKAVGHSAEATVELSAQLYRDGRISAAQARAIADFYDAKFQPAYRVAVTAAQLDLSRPAPAELLALATQLTALVSAYLPAK